MQTPLQASERSGLSAPPPATFVPLPHASDAQRAVSAASTAAASAALEVSPRTESGHSAEEAQSAAQGQLRPPVPQEAEAVETEAEAEAASRLERCESYESVAVEVVGEAEGLRLHLNAENATGYRGCYLVTSRGGQPTPFKAQANGTQHLGYFATAVEAAVCYAQHMQAEAVVAEAVEAAGVPATAGAARNPREAAHRRWGMQPTGEAAAPPLLPQSKALDAATATASRAERVCSGMGESSAAPAQARVSTRRGGAAGMRCGCGKPLEMLECDKLTCDVCERQLTQSSTVSLARPA